MYYVGALEVRTPGLVLAEMRSVDVLVDQLTGDIGRSHVDDDFRAGFAGFLSEWNQFYEDHAEGAMSWLSRGTTPVYNKTIDFKRRAIGWAEAFKAAGGDVTPYQASESGVKKLTVWPFVAGAGVALGLVYLIYGKVKR